MTIQFDDTIRNAQLEAIESQLGTSPILRIRSGAKPANCAAADSGTILATATLPSDWMADAASGVKVKAGTWSDAGADNTGTVGHFRIYTSGGTCKMQGTCTITGGGGDMTIDDDTLTAGQPVTVTGFSLTGGNA